MKDLNEKLAEVCGLTPFDKSKCSGCGLSADRQRCAWEAGSGCPRLNMPDYLDSKGRAVFNWNPTTNLNQLRECYLAAEAGSITFSSRFAFELGVLIVRKLNLQFADTKDKADAWVKHPELVAHAILKAKGVV